VSAGEIYKIRLVPNIFINPHQSKGDLIMSLLKRFTQKFQARRAALNARRIGVGHRVSTWWQTHRQTLCRAVVMVLIGLVAGIVLALIWRRSPTLRAAVLGAAAVVAAFIRPGKRQPGEAMPVPVLEPTDNHHEPIHTF
jgi:hypothetical protein